MDWGNNRFDLWGTKPYIIQGDSNSKDGLLMTKYNIGRAASVCPGIPILLFFLAGNT